MFLLPRTGLVIHSVEVRSNGKLLLTRKTVRENLGENLSCLEISLDLYGSL